MNIKELDEMLRVSTVAKRLCVSRRHIYRLIMTKKLAAKDISSGTKRPEYRIRSSDLELYLNGQKKQLTQKNKK